MKQITAKLTSNGPLLLKSDRLANPMAQITKDLMYSFVLFSGVM